MSAEAATAIVPYRSKLPVVQFAADGVAADVRVEPLDRRTGSSVYAIRLASAGEDVTGRLVGENGSGEPVELGDLTVGPGSAGGARLAVTPPPGGYRAVYLEIRSARVLLRIEAPAPPAPRRTGRLRIAAIVLGMGVLSAGAGLLALAVPETPVLQAPERAVAGEPVRVPYVAHGFGDERFTARYDDGIVFASGALPGKTGDLTVTLPRDAAHRRIWVAVTTQGVLGNAAGVTSFAVAAPTPAPTRVPIAARAAAPLVAAVLPQPPPTPAPAAVPQALSETAGMLRFAPQGFAGSELPVRVMPHRGAVTVAMQDADGATIAEREIAPGATSATLLLPERPGTYYLLVRYESDEGLQTVVRPVRALAPRNAQESSR
jgi:hypothetical protein